MTSDAAHNFIAEISLHIGANSISPPTFKSKHRKISDERYDQYCNMFNDEHTELLSEIQDIRSYTLAKL